MRLLCALIAELQGEISGGDVKQAYGQAPWPKNLQKSLGRVPLGYDTFYNGIEHCVEVGNLYGHPLAGRHWWKTFLQWMLADGFTQSDHDPCLFFRFREKDFLFVIVYVDDIIAFHTENSALRAEWAVRFGKTFEWTDFGTDLHDFLSVRITRGEAKSVELDMTAYIKDMVSEHFPGGVHYTYNTPAVTEIVNDVYQAGVQRDTSYIDDVIATRFRRIVMQCLYVATHIRPDISHAVGLLTRVIAWPSPTLVKHAERVLAYLAGTASLGLKYVKTDNMASYMAWAPRVTVEGASDADFGIAHSTSGYVYFLANAAISWIVKKQVAIALSTYEAEVVAGSLAGCEAVYIRAILAELGFAQLKPTILKMDSSSAIDLANDPVMHATSKHIARRDLFIRELVSRDVVKPILVKTEHNPADMLTKPLRKGVFLPHRETFLGQ